MGMGKDVKRSKSRVYYVVRMLLAVCLTACLSVCLTACGKVVFNGNEGNLPTTSAKATDGAQQGNRATDAPSSMPTHTPTPMPTQKPVTPTEPAATPTEASKPLTPSPKPTATPTPTEAVREPATLEEAMALLQTAIGADYSVKQAGTVLIGDTAYYLFEAGDASRVYSPLLAVEANSRVPVYFYSSDEIVELTKFPPDNLESVGGETTGDEGDFSKDDAIALLGTLSAEQLELPAALSEYTVMADDWTTMVYGTECYCINVYAELTDRKQLMGVFFVAVDGADIYRGEFEDFIKIQ